MTIQDGVGVEEYPDRDDVNPDEASETLDDDGTPGAGGLPPGQASA